MSTDKLPGSDEQAVGYHIPADEKRGWEPISLNGFSKLEYACIHLELPESGTPWLDELIAKKQRQSIAAKAMQGFIAAWGQHDVTNLTEISHHAALAAKAILNELNKK